MDPAIFPQAPMDPSRLDDRGLAEGPDSRRATAIGSTAGRSRERRRMYPCGALCDRQAVDYARRRIPTELETHPYRCRFIDTTTAAPWNECYSPTIP